METHRITGLLVAVTVGAGALWFRALAVPQEATPVVSRRRPHFTDVASQSKFTYISNNDLSPRKYFLQPMCGGIAILDYDNDGKMDIFFTNGAKLPELKKTGPSFYNCLLRNRGDGTFEDVTNKAGLAGADLDYNFGVAAGDYDNDGRTDLFICSAGRNVLYHNNGDGTFTDVTRQSGIGGKPPGTVSIGAAWVDYDNDRLPDPGGSNDTEANSLFINKGDGTFEDQGLQLGVAYDDSAKAVSSMGSDAKDYDNDGRVDIFYNNLMTQIWGLFQNRGDS